MPQDFNSIPLRDIHLPDPVSWWPPAIGWWLLLLLLVVMGLIAFWYLRRCQRYTLQRHALRELNKLQAAYNNNFDARRFVKQLSVLIRRISISVYPPQQVAGLTGSTWLNFLDSGLEAKANKSGYAFSTTIGKVLISFPYTKEISSKDVDVEALCTLTAEWIRSLPLPPAGPRGFAVRTSANLKGKAHAAV